jgi:hypothetical protein
MTLQPQGLLAVTALDPSVGSLSRRLMVGPLAGLKQSRSMHLSPRSKV